MIRTGILIFALCSFGWLATAQAAPANKADKTVQHVVGTVTAIDAKHIVVKTTKGPLVSLKLTKQVKFKNKQHPQSNNPPAAGDRVIIQATKDKKGLTADIIHYSPMGQASEPPE